MFRVETLLDVKPAYRAADFGDDLGFERYHVEEVVEPLLKARSLVSFLSVGGEEDGVEEAGGVVVADFVDSGAEVETGAGEDEFQVARQAWSSSTGRTRSVLLRPVMSPLSHAT